MTVAEAGTTYVSDISDAPSLREVVDNKPTLELAPDAPAPADMPLVRPSLSAREQQVLLMWLASESKEDAAERLYISASTVSTHISRIRAKYSAVARPAPTKAHMLARALQDGYTTLDVW